MTNDRGGTRAAGWLPNAHDEVSKLRQAKAGFPHLQKMINTIFALVDAELSGAPVTGVFKRPECCSLNTYYTNWQYDEDFTTCLEGVRRVAREWHDGRALRAIEEAAEKLALLAPLAADTAGQGLSTYHNMDTRLRAAFAILDRAGLKTAAKTQHQLLGDAHGFGEMEDDELDLVLTNLLMAAGISPDGEE